jgi:hypothetical protein
LHFSGHGQEPFCWGAFPVKGPCRAADCKKSVTALGNPSRQAYSQQLIQRGVLRWSAVQI